MDYWHADTLGKLVEDSNKQLYDPDLEIAKHAVLVLDNLCQRDSKIASAIVRCRPIFVNVSGFAFNLMTRYPHQKDDCVGY